MFANGNARLGQYQTAMQYFGADALGSVRQIYDASAQVVGSSRYDPFGNAMSQSGATSVFAFAGEQHDATGLTYLRARFYSAAQGRFTTRDVWEGDPNAPMSYNAWLYAYANAANLSDPSGKVPTSPPNRPGATGCPDWFLCEFFRSHGIILHGCDAIAPPPAQTPVPTKVAYAVPKSVANDAKIREAWGWLKETRVSEPETGIELADAYSNFTGTVTWGSFSEERHDCSGSARIGGSVTVSAIEVYNRFDDEARRTGYTAMILGHEAVHVINPYRACRGSLYEEFHAYELEEQVNQKILTTRSVLVQPSYDMQRFDPLSRESLMRFFASNHPEYRDIMATNKQIDEYPPGIVPRP